MKEKIINVFLLFLITIIFFSSINVLAAGKRVIAENKYIWIYVDGERKLIAEEDGYPCFGQGIDNKNVLYMPLNIICDMVGYEVSPLKKIVQNAEGTEYTIYVTVSNGTNSFDVSLGATSFNGVALAGETFVLKGTEASGNPVVMVPLGIAKDYFNLDIEVKRPVGRGIYDYCSLAINFSGNELSEGDDIMDVPNGDDSSDRPDIDEGDVQEGFYYVSTANNHYHAYNCSLINKSYSKLSEYECIFWGYEKCPTCLGN